MQNKPYIRHLREPSIFSSGKEHEAVRSGVYLSVNEHRASHVTQSEGKRERFLKKSIAIAPMMDWTDKHFRYLVRLISKNLILYTEMVVTGAILKGDRQKFLDFHSIEQPLAIQLGGSNPRELAECARICEDWGYQEINLNVGCPSDKVQAGRIGACLMLDPDCVAECVAAMKQQVKIPITVKTRLGVDQHDSQEFLYNFIDKVQAAGCQHFILHARKAILKGLSPRANRVIPPLQYDRVYQLKQDYPHLQIILNGGVQSLQDIELHLSKTDGVMIGRSAYNHTAFLMEIEKYFYNNLFNLSVEEIYQAYFDYCHQQHQLTQKPLRHMLRHAVGLFHGQPHAKEFRKRILG